MNKIFIGIIILYELDVIVRWIDDKTPQDPFSLLGWLFRLFFPFAIIKLIK